MAIMIDKGNECWYINGDGVVAVHVTKSQLVFKLFQGEEVVVQISGIEDNKQLKMLTYHLGVHLHSDTIADLDWIIELVKRTKGERSK